MLKVSMLKLLQANGNSKYSQKAPKKPATRYGLPVICWKELAKAMAYPLTGIANRLALWIGTVRACTPTSQTAFSEPAEAKKFTKRYWKPSALLWQSTLLFMAPITICV